MQGRFFKSSLTIILLLFSTIMVAIGQSSVSPKIINAELDITNLDFDKAGSIELNGNWLFIWDKIITPVNYSDSLGQQSSILVNFPGVWTDYSHTKQSYSSFGKATYQLTLTGLDTNKEYALKLPDMYSSYQLWIGNNLIAKNGNIDDNKESYRPQWLPQTVTFTPTHSTETLLLNIANFHHTKGGIKNEIKFGNVGTLMKQQTHELNANLVSTLGIAIVCILALIAYFKSSNKLFIYFACFSLLWSIRGLFSGMYLIYNWFPDFNWVLGVKIEYLTIYTSVMVGYYTFHRLFPEHSKKSLNYVSIIVNGLFILITIFAPPIIFTQLLNIYFTYMAITLLYVLIEVIRAYIHDEKGAGYISIAIAMVILLFLYDMLSYYKYLPQNPYIISIGYVLFYSLLGFSIYYNMVNKKAPITYQFSH